MDVRLPDGTIIKNVPEGTTKAELTAKLARNGYDISRLADKSVPGQGGVPMPESGPSGVSRFGAGLIGAADAGLSMLSQATTGLLGRAGGTLGGIAGSVATGRYGTQEGAAMASQVAQDTAHRFSYEPKTNEGREILEYIGKVFDKTKLAGMGPSEAMMLANVSAPPGALRQNASVARDATSRFLTKNDADWDVPAAPNAATPGTMMSGGSAGTDLATIRRQRAGELPVPVQLTKGQATRDFSQVQFEREAAKNPTVGAPLRERFAEQNRQILQNFDAWIDQTGAQSGGLRATGQVVNDALVNKANRAKAEINVAYKKAREAGDMQEPVNIAPLVKYLEDHRAEAINAPVLQSVDAKIKYVSKNGVATINDLEELRQMVGKLGQRDATNGIFAKEVRKLIDELTDGVGGDLYRQARDKRARYAREFEDHAVIDRLLSMKPGTKDRAVAYEDVFSHSILKGSLDDVRTVRKVLQTAGADGQQAWRELQGATLRHIRDEITQSTQLDMAGNRPISAARLDRLVTELDKDGKLDFIFGKQGAQQIRDINGIAQDAFTAPVGSVNHSNTSSILTQALDKMAGKVTGVPFLGQAAGYISREMRDAAARKRVQQSISDK